MYIQNIYTLSAEDGDRPKFKKKVSEPLFLKTFLKKYPSDGVFIHLLKASSV